MARNNRRRDSTKRKKALAVLAAAAAAALFLFKDSGGGGGGGGGFGIGTGNTDAADTDATATTTQGSADPGGTPTRADVFDVQGPAQPVAMNPSGDGPVAVVGTAASDDVVVSESALDTPAQTDTEKTAQESFEDMGGNVSTSGNGGDSGVPEPSFDTTSASDDTDTSSDSGGGGGTVDTSDGVTVEEAVEISQGATPQNTAQDDSNDQPRLDENNTIRGGGL